MGVLADVVVSSNHRAVSGSHPDCLPLAPPACCPRPVQLLPSGFGRCSANNGENNSHSYVRHIREVFSIQMDLIFFHCYKCDSKISFFQLAKPVNQMEIYFMLFSLLRTDLDRSMW